MTRSMTAFARADADTPWGRLACELRSVNHRYLEISAKLPEELRALETRIRELAGKHLERGKLECLLRLQLREAGAGALELDEARVRRVLEAGERVRSFSSVVVPLRTIDVLRWPGVLKSDQLDAEALAEAALELVARAFAELVATRAREGERLNAFLRQRLEAMARVVTEVRAIVPQVTAAYRERLVARLAELRQQLDPNRLEQEIVLFASRTDVAEELDRLDTHIGEAQRVLGQPGAAGRRLDFLMQEFNREANTLASKAADIRLTNAAVELKVLIEQMREQVQNIE